MNTEFKGTKGEWRNPEGTTFITSGSKQMIDYAGYKTTEEEDDANAQLIIDAGNTIQSCGLLPSQLLKQNNEMIELLKNSQEAIKSMDMILLDDVLEKIDNYFESTNP